MTTLIIIAGIIIAGMGYGWRRAYIKQADLHRMQQGALEAREHARDIIDRRGVAIHALYDIERATRNGKSGTARMVHRMAKKALDV